MHLYNCYAPFELFKGILDWKTLQHLLMTEPLFHALSLSPFVLFRCFCRVTNHDAICDASLSILVYGYRIVFRLSFTRSIYVSSSFKSRSIGTVQSSSFLLKKIMISSQMYTRNFCSRHSVHGICKKKIDQKGFHCTLHRTYAYNCWNCCRAESRVSVSCEREEWTTRHNMASECIEREVSINGSYCWRRVSPDIAVRLSSF